MVGDVIIYELRVMSYELEIFYASCELLFASWKLKLQVANLFYELQVMALFHLKKKFTKHSEDCKSLLPV